LYIAFLQQAGGMTKAVVALLGLGADLDQAALTLVRACSLDCLVAENTVERPRNYLIGRAMRTAEADQSVA
jgi:hypothetical protein